MILARGMSARRRAARRKLKQIKGACNYSDDLDIDDDNEDELGVFTCSVSKTDATPATLSRDKMAVFALIRRHI